MPNGKDEAEITELETLFPLGRAQEAPSLRFFSEVYGIAAILSLSRSETQTLT